MSRRVEEVQMEIEREEVSLAEMLRNLKKRVFEQNELSLLEFFGEMHTRREIVTAFFAILEIVRTENIRLTQSATFGDIILRKI
jgi:chromatin segregation and condensation protein Rec8/ScpA/Scc1 (kleisin family)